MKKLILFLLLGYSSLLYSQPVMLMKGEIKDLKDCVSKYITVYMTWSVTIVTRVSTDDGLIGSFIDKETGKKILFTSYTQLFNYMDKWGWRYVDKIEDPLIGKLVYLFEKKDVKLNLP